MSYIAEEKYAYSRDEALEMIVHSARANKVCAALRKDFNLCRATILGKMIEPGFCEEKAAKLVDCFQTVRKDASPGLQAKYEQAFTCAKGSGGGCDKLLQAYADA